MASMVRRRGILGGIALVGAGVALVLIASRAEREREELAPAAVVADRTQDSAPVRDTSEVAVVSAAVASPKSEQGWTLRGRLMRYPDPEALEPTQPAAGALLRLSPGDDTKEPRPDFVPREVRSGSDGRFEFAGVPGKAEYRLDVDAHGSGLEALVFQLPEIAEAGTKEIPDIVLEEPERLVVVVKGPKRLALETVKVSASSTSGLEKSRPGELEAQSRDVDAELREGGQFVFERLPRGFVYVVATAPGFVSDSGHVRVPHSDVFELRLLEGETISGTVRSTKGVPIPGATVREPGGERTQTDDEGLFVLAGLDGGGAYEIIASAAGFADVHQHLASPEVDLVLPLEAVLSGRVLAASTGLPLTGATVSSEQGDSAVTGENGAFLLGGLAPASHEVRIQHPAHAPLLAGTWDLEEGDQVTDLELRLEPALSASGRVLSAKTGAPVPLARVSASSDTVGTTAICNASGNFVLSGLIEGEYRITVTAEGFAETGTQATLPSASPETSTFLLDEEARLHGRVLDPEGKPVAGARVDVGHRGKEEPEAFRRSWRKEAWTDSRGAYRFAGLPAFGDYCLLAALDEKFALAWVEGISLASGEEKTVDLQLARGGDIRGRVRSAGSSQPIEVTVSVFPRGKARAPPQDLRFPDLEESSGPGWVDVNADPSGDFEILQLWPGAYQVHVFSEVHRSARLDVDVDVGSARHLDIVLDEGFTVSGRVIDPSGNPVNGATVSVSGPGHTTYARSDENGLFAAHGLTAGRGSIEASRFGLHGRRLPCDIPSSDNLFTMAPTPIISGRVSARGQKILPACHVNASRMDGEEGEFSDTPDAAGRFTAALPPGRYFLHAQAEGFASNRLQVELRPGERREVVLELVRSGSLRVRLEVEGPEKHEGRVYVEGPSCAHLVEPTEYPGAVVFEDVPSGHLGLLAVAWEHGLVRHAGIVITAGTTSEVTLQMPAVQGIFGQVTRRGEPVDGARVGAQGPGGSHFARTSSSGWYQIEELEAGAYEVHVEDARRTITVTREKAVELDVDLAARLVSGTVTVAGRPAANVLVQATGLLRSSLDVTNTDAAGEWSLQLLVPEEYDISFGEEGAEGRVTRNLSLEPGAAEARLDVALESLPMAEPEGPEEQEQDVEKDDDGDEKSQPEDEG